MNAASDDGVTTTDDNVPFNVKWGLDDTSAAYDTTNSSAEVSDDTTVEDKAATTQAAGASEETGAQVEDAGGNDASSTTSNAASTVAYTVKHMLMDTDGTNYTVKDTEHLTGTAGTSVSPTVKAYEGFNSPNIQTATLAEDKPSTGDTAPIGLYVGITMAALLAAAFVVLLQKKRRVSK